MTTERQRTEGDVGAGDPVRPPAGDPSGAAESPRSGSARSGSEERSSGRREEGVREDAPAGGTGEGSGPGRRPLGDGIRQGLGVLSAFKDALEETIQEARDRGELSTDRARDLMQQALHRAREAAGDARERLDFAPQQDLDALRMEVGELRARVQQLEARLTRTGQRPEGKQGGGEAPGGAGSPSP